MAIEGIPRVLMTDVGMTDVGMPEMNGRERAERVHARRPDVRVLLYVGVHRRHHHPARTC